MGIAFKIFLTIWILAFFGSIIVAFSFGILSLLTDLPVFRKIMGYAWAVLVISVVLWVIIIGIIFVYAMLHSIWTG